MHARSVGEPVECDGEPLPRDCRGVGKPVGLGDEVDDVHPEAVDTAVEPPAHDVVDGLAHLRVLPVEVRLLTVEQVQVVLAGRGFPLPGRSAEERAPVVRFGAAGGVAPDVPVPLRVLAR